MTAPTAVKHGLLATRKGRIATFFLLYMSEGIPFGFSATALVTYLRQSGIGLAEIGYYTAWLYGPWTVKWAWAPIVDLVRPARFGPRRFWIGASHIMMIVTMAALLVFDPGKNFQLLVVVMVIHNVFAATQDVAIDALAVDVLEEEERGLANGFMFGGSTFGQTIGGSGALYVASAFGFNWSYTVVLGALALVLFAVTFRIQESPVLAQHAPGTAGPALREVWGRFRTFGRNLFEGFFRAGRGPILGIFFALLPSGTVALGLALGTTIQVDAGMTDRQIADLALVSTLLGALACIAGGWIGDRFGQRRMLVTFYALTLIPALWLAVQFTGDGMAGVTISEVRSATIAYGIASGLLNGTYLAIFMGLTSVRVAATQFTAYMAMGNTAYTYSSAWQGKLAAAEGYAAVLILDSLIVLLPIAIIPFLGAARHREALPPALDPPATLEGDAIP